SRGAPAREERERKECGQDGGDGAAVPPEEAHARDADGAEVEGTDGEERQPREQEPECQAEPPPHTPYSSLAVRRAGGQNRSPSPRPGREPGRGRGPAPASAPRAGPRAGLTRTAD